MRNRLAAWIHCRFWQGRFWRVARAARDMLITDDETFWREVREIGEVSEPDYRGEWGA